MMRQDAMNNEAQKTDAEQPIAVTMASSKTPKHVLKLRVLPSGVSLLTEALAAFGSAYGQSMMGKKLREKFRKTRAEKVLHMTNTYKRVAKVLAALSEEVRYTLMASEITHTVDDISVKTTTLTEDDKRSITNRMLADHGLPDLNELQAAGEHLESYRPAMMAWRVYGRLIATVLETLKSQGMLDESAHDTVMRMLTERAVMSNRLAQYDKLLQPFATKRDQTLMCTLERLLKELAEHRQA